MKNTRLYNSTGVTALTVESLSIVLMSWRFDIIRLLFPGLSTTHDYDTRPRDQRVDDGEGQGVDHPRLQSRRRFVA